MSLHIYKKLTSADDSTYTLQANIADGVTSNLVSGLIPETGYTYMFVREEPGKIFDPVIITAITQATPVNTSPVANAGADNTITLPTNSVTLVGSGTDPDGTIASYLWEQTIGAAAIITTPNAATTTVTGLVEGTYEFRLTVTDNQGATHQDTVQITVNPEVEAQAVDGGLIAGQSNASSLAEQEDLTAEQKGPFSKVLIYNKKAGAIQPLQVGVNEAGLNGGATDSEPRADGATIAPGLESYKDGFGPEVGLALGYQPNETNPVYLLKPYVEEVLTTDSSTLDLWHSTIFPAYETDYNTYKAALSAQNKTLSTKWIYWSHGEAGTNTVQLNSLMDKFRTLTGNPNLKIIIQATRGASNQYAATRALQMEYVLQEPNALFLDLGPMNYLGDGVHIAADSMLAIGQKLYSMTYGAIDATAPTVISRAVINNTTIRVVFSEPVLGDLAGVSFPLDGSTLIPTAMSGNGTDTIDYTVEFIAAGAAVSHSYNATTGKICDFSRNKLASFTTQTVTNSGDIAAPVLQSATTRVENEYSAANQIILAYNEPLNPASVLTNSDITISPSNTLSSAAVSGNNMILTFANNFAPGVGIVMSTANSKVKDLSGNSALNLSGVGIYNWVAALASGWDIVAMPAGPNLVNNNNFWRTTTTTEGWGQGARLGIKLPSGVNGGLAQHYTKPTFMGAVGLKTTDAFDTGIAGTNYPTMFKGFFIDSGKQLTWTRQAAGQPGAGIVKTAILGYWYRVWRVGTVLTLDESPDGVNWTTVHTYDPDGGGDLFGMMDLYGNYFDAKTQYVQQKGLVTV